MIMLFYFLNKLKCYIYYAMNFHLIFFIGNMDNLKYYKVTTKCIQYYSGFLFEQRMVMYIKISGL